MEHAARRILHIHVTAHPTAQWTLQQLREAMPSDHPYRFMIHDRDSIFAQALDQHIRSLGLHVLRTPPHQPQANALCERLLGTLRRECLDFVILEALSRFLAAFETVQPAPVSQPKAVCGEDNVIYVEVGYRTEEDTFLAGDQMAEVGA
jgi:hypothetical protein